MNAKSDQTNNQQAQAKGQPESPVLCTSAGIFFQAPPESDTRGSTGAGITTIKPTSNFGY